MGNISLWVVFDENKERLEATKKHLVGLGTITTHSVSTRDNLKELIERTTRNTKEIARQERGMIINLDTGISAITPMVKQYRIAFPASPVLVAVSKISSEELAEMVRCGVSQVLHHGFTQESLITKMNQAIAFQAQIATEKRAGPQNRSGKIWLEDWHQDWVVVKLVGWISEGSQFPKIKRGPSQTSVIFDCERETGINSLGIRLWVLWLKTVEDLGFETIVYDNVRRHMLRVLATVKSGFNIEQKINSFYMTYYSPETNHEAEKLFVRGKDFDDNILRLPRSVAIGVKGKEETFVIDDMILNYLTFFKGKIELI